MSTAYNKRKKLRRSQRTLEEKAIDRKIKKGVYPRYMLCPNASSMQSSLERDSRGKVIWKQVSTKKVLLSLSEKEIQNG